MVFEELYDRPVPVPFDEPASSVDGSALVLGAPDRRLGPTRRLAGAVREIRRGAELDARAEIAVIDEPQIVETEAQAAAVVCLTVRREEIQSVMGPAIAEVMGALAAQRIAPAGPVFSHHFRIDPAVFDFEVGVAVAHPVAATGRVRASALPAARVARTVYRGPYEGLGAAWGEFSAWLAAAGHRPADDLWECYLAGPESSSDPSAWRTELDRPLLP